MEQKEFDALIEQIKGSLPETVKTLVKESGLKMEDVEKALTEKTISKADFDTFKEAMESSVLELKNSREAEKQTKKTLADEIKESKDTLKKIAKGEPGEVELKATVSRSSVDGNAQAYNLPDIGQLATRKATMTDIFPTLTVGGSNHNGVINYYDWDEDTIARSAATIAEGGTFPESTAKFKKYSTPIQKLGDTLPVTAEFFEDEQMFAAELQMFLDTNIALKTDEEIALGDGTGTHLKGLVETAPEYTLPVAGVVEKGSVYDLAVLVAAQITSTGGSKYMPDVFIAPSSTISKMLLTKDENGQYVLPPFVMPNGTQIKGMQVIESNILEGEVAFVICDRRFAKIYQIPGVSVEKGYVGNQFIEDTMTLKVRKRLAFLIRKADESGFRKVTDLDAALTAITI